MGRWEGAHHHMAPTEWGVWAVEEDLNLIVVGGVGVGSDGYIMSLLSPPESILYLRIVVPLHDDPVGID